MSKFIPKWVAVQLHICFAQFKLRLLLRGLHNLTFFFFSNVPLFSRFSSASLVCGYSYIAFIADQTATLVTLSSMKKI